MRIKSSLLSLALASVSFASHSATPFGEKVNCRTVTTGQVAIYEGYSSCFIKGIKLGAYVFPTTSPTYVITEQYNGYFYQCEASVPFSHYAPVTSTVCDYKPVANFIVMQHNFSLVSTSKDYDGNVVKHEWWINGIKQASTGTTVGFPIPNSSSQNILVKLKVTDNQNYTNTIERTVTVTNDDCTTQSCRNR